MAKQQQQAATAEKSTKTAKKRTVKAEATGQAHINATFNNIIITFTNLNGQTVSWSSAGKMGFKGAKKNTPFAAQRTAEDASKYALEAGMKKVKVFVKGPGSGRDSAMRTLGAAGIEVTEIVDITPNATQRMQSPKKKKSITKR